jgi:hypothetical protein
MTYLADAVDTRASVQVIIVKIVLEYILRCVMSGQLCVINLLMMFVKDKKLSTSVTKDNRNHKRIGRRWECE